MTPNTYHEEIPDQDVVSQIERMERRDMSITPEKLRVLANVDISIIDIPNRIHAAATVGRMAEALRAAADEIEALLAEVHRSHDIATRALILTQDRIDEAAKSLKP